MRDITVTLIHPYDLAGLLMGRVQIMDVIKPPDLSTGEFLEIDGKLYLQTVNEPVTTEAGKQYI